MQYLRVVRPKMDIISTTCAERMRDRRDTFVCNTTLVRLQEQFHRDMNVNNRRYGYDPKRNRFLLERKTVPK